MSLWQKAYDISVKILTTGKVRHWVGRDTGVRPRHNSKYKNCDMLNYLLPCIVEYRYIGVAIPAVSGTWGMRPDLLRRRLRRPQWGSECIASTRIRLPLSCPLSNVFDCLERYSAYLIIVEAVRDLLLVRTSLWSTPKRAQGNVSHSRGSRHFLWAGIDPKFAADFSQSYERDLA